MSEREDWLRRKGERVERKAKFYVFYVFYVCTLLQHFWWCCWCWCGWWEKEQAREAHMSASPTSCFSSHLKKNCNVRVQVHPTLPWFACNKKQRDGGGDWVREVKDDDEERRKRKTVKEVNQGNNNSSNNTEATCLCRQDIWWCDWRPCSLFTQFLCVHKDVVGVI